METLSLGLLSGRRSRTRGVWGAQVHVFSVDDARRFLQLFPHAEYCAVADAHHMVAGDDNKAFDAVFGDYLDRRIRSRLDLFTP